MDTCSVQTAYPAAKADSIARVLAGRTDAAAPFHSASIQGSWVPLDEGNRAIRLACLRDLSSSLSPAVVESGVPSSRITPFLS